MKLEFSYKLDTHARDGEQDSQNSLFRKIDNRGVEFTFDDDHNVVGMNIFFTNVKVLVNGLGQLDVSLHEKETLEAHTIANYVACRFYELTGKCEFAHKNIPTYVPETEEERKELEGKTYAKLPRTISFEVLVHEDILSEHELNRYVGQKDALAMYVDAKKMKNPTGKYREFFRVIEHYFPYESRRFDRDAHHYLVGVDPKYTEDFIRHLRILRNRCSHGKRKRDYITSSDLKGVKEIEDKMADVQRISKFLLDNPPK